MEISKKFFYDHWKSILCFAVHLFLLWAVFDTYYNSPLVHGMTPHGEMADDVAPASRLVLFVADGLRAHSLYENVSRAPFLRKIMSSIGSWGVSHTRVPTESRPGHVALIAGFYEDVSAVTKGWQENPVEFDSVFNESRFTWSWGSPDILPMFAKGASGQRVFTKCYDSSSEDFASSDASKLDTWVFDEVKAFFKAAESNESLSSMLRQQKIIFFLHLLGLDTNGHGYKPRSDEYIQNIRVVDEGIAEMYGIVERFFNNDGRTAYLFSSDHGMTDWGSHGAGEAHETMTPLIAWGAGVTSSVEKPDFTLTDELDFSISSTMAGRKDVNQADVAPLMASLVGINMPMNSVGLLPSAYLNASQRYRAAAACANFRQLIEQMEVQRRRKYETSFRIFFNDFPTLTPSKLKMVLGEIDKLYVQKRFPVAERLCQEWSPVAVEGLLYYHQYERRFLSVCVAFTFVFLELCVWRFAGEAADDDSEQDAIISAGGYRVLLVSSSVAGLLFWSVSFPLSRYSYGLIPLLLAAIAQPFWRHRIKYRLSISFESLRNPTIVLGELKRWIISVATSDVVLLLFVVAVAIEIIVWAFFYRWILSVGLWVLILWPMTNPLIGWNLRSIWTTSCLALSVFPLLPTVGKSTNPELIFYTCVAVGIVFVFVYIVYLHRIWRIRRDEGVVEESGFVIDAEHILFGVLFAFILVSGCISLTTSVSIEQKRGTPLVNRLLSWSILLISPCLALFARRDLQIRLCVLVVALFCPFTLMSVSYEPLFYVCLALALYVWLRIENAIEQGSDPRRSNDFANHLLVDKKPLNFDDARRAYLFVYFVFLSFFGTGNIASINSFNPSFIAPFVTVFSPFVMGALLLTKIAIPFLIVCSVLCGLEATTARSVGVLFWLIVMISDGMALRFFFLLRDQGSWLDIGTSISHFVISSAAILIVMILYHLAKVLLTKSVSFDVVDNKRHVL